MNSGEVCYLNLELTATHKRKHKFSFYVNPKELLPTFLPVGSLILIYITGPVRYNSFSQCSVLSGLKCHVFFCNVPYLLPNSSVPVESDKGKTLTEDKSHSSQTPFTYVMYQQCKYNNIILVQVFNCQEGTGYYSEDMKIN